MYGYRIGKFIPYSSHGSVMGFVKPRKKAERKGFTLIFTACVCLKNVSADEFIDQNQ